VIDLDAAMSFVWLNARLIDRHRLAHLLRGADPSPVVEALRRYRNPDGGFGNALEPDLRAPASQPGAVWRALDVLDEVGAFDDPMVAGARDWLSGVAMPDGGLPFVLASADEAPHAP
jgi:hypothetical protein